MSELSEKIERLEDIDETWTRVLKEMSRSFSSDLFDMVQGIAYDPNYVILNLLQELADRRKLDKPRDASVSHEELMEKAMHTNMANDGWTATTYDERDMQTRKYIEQKRDEWWKEQKMKDSGSRQYAVHFGKQRPSEKDACRYCGEIITDASLHVNALCRGETMRQAIFSLEECGHLFTKLRRQMVDLGLLSEDATDQMAFIAIRDMLNDHAEQEKQAHNPAYRPFEEPSSKV